MSISLSLQTPTSWQDAEVGKGAAHKRSASWGSMDNRREVRDSGGNQRGTRTPSRQCRMVKALWRVLQPQLCSADRRWCSVQRTHGFLFIQGIHEFGLASQRGGVGQLRSCKGMQRRKLLPSWARVESAFFSALRTFHTYERPGDRKLE